MPFQGAVAVVTGGSGGLGRALAHGLLARGASCVVAADIAPAPADHPGLRPAVLDVTDEAAVARLVDEVEAGIGPVGFWFSNAGVNPGLGLGAPEDWRAALDVNLMAHVHAARHVLPRMERRGWGGFVVTASAAGLLSDPRGAPYTASKHASVGLAEWLAITAGEGVTINCVCPEGVRTGMTRTGISRNGTTRTGMTCTGMTCTGPGAASAEMLDADVAAGRALDGIARGDFLVLTHPRTAEFAQRRVLDRARWLRGMRRHVRAPALT